MDGLAGWGGEGGNGSNQIGRAQGERWAEAKVAAGCM